ncbi:MAG: hypothetical protein NC300_07450 [Bacteroidales bacterium]|nr:hypothetical protein [Clostridium sp.]MCM1203963.1 hypothetical protein [Bacteroidales bacterium]
METKNRLIEKLLKVAKRHKVLTYPVLALVAVISIISYCFDWSTGAGKRVVAIVMVMVMLVSQSYFLTSSATELIDDEDAAMMQKELQEEQLVETPSDTAVPGNPTEKATETVPSDTAVTSSTESVTNPSDVYVEDGPGRSDTDGEIPADEKGKPGQRVSGTDKENDLEDEDLNSGLADTRSRKEISYICAYIDASGSEKMISSGGRLTSNEDNGSGTPEGDYTYQIEETVLESVLASANTDMGANGHNADGCYNFAGWYTDRACTDKITDFTAVKANDRDSNGNPMIVFYCRRDLTKYKVNIIKGNDINNDADKVDYVVEGAIGSVERGATSFYIPVTGTGSNISGTVTLKELTRPKCSLSGVTGGTSQNFQKGGSEVTVNFSGMTSQQWTITLKWDGRPYQIRYAKDEAGTDFVTQNVVYHVRDDQDDYFFLTGDIVEKKEGYEFLTWKIGPAVDAEKIVKPETTMISVYQDRLYSESEEDIVTLYPVYTYAGFILNGMTNDGKDQEMTLEYDYLKPADAKSFTAAYTYTDGRIDENPTFTYSLSGQTDLEKYGIIAGYRDGDNTKGVVVSTAAGGPLKRTENGKEPKLTITVKPGNGDAEKVFTLTIKIHPKRIKVIVPEENKTKIYDGTKDAPDNFPTEMATDAGKPDVYVVYTGTGKPQYNSKDVADADRIILPSGSWELHVPAGDEGNYEIDGGDIVVEDCHILRRTIIMRTKTSKQVIRAGEDTPVDYFSVELETSIPGNQLVGDDKLESLIQSITYTTEPARNKDDRKSMEVTGDFKILGSSPTDSNYEIRYLRDLEGSNQGSGLGQFHVMKEKPELGLNYYFSEEQDPDNLWYQSASLLLLPVLEVNSLGGYDTVCISRDGGKTFENGGELREEDSVNPSLRVKLYDSRTGAVTDDEAFKVRYDKSGPEYKGYTVHTSELEYDSATAIPEGGLFFPGIGGVMDFGTYIKSIITIQIRYEDNASGLDSLHYGLFGGPTTNEVGFNRNTGVATISILRNSIQDADKKVGVITCYAVDKAGNMSAPIKLRPDNSNSDNYEWSVEQAGPVVSPIVVKAGEDQTDIVKNQSGVSEDKMVYYRNCVAELEVTDTISGIYGITWHINDTDIEKRVDNPENKTEKQTFTQSIGPSSSSPYTVYATVTDNAGNTVDSDKFTLKVDDENPKLRVFYDGTEWTKDTTIYLTASDELSGVDYVTITDSTGNEVECELGEPNEKGVYRGSFQAETKGKYTIILADKAGNKTVWENEITNISTAKPGCPEITVVPAEPDGENGWYRTEPEITIQNVTETDEELPTPVVTSYRRWKTGGNAEAAVEIEGPSQVLRITEEGEENVKAWSVSASGVECDNKDSHVVTVKHDKTAPVITITPEKGNNASVLVSFTITDEVSGVNGDSIKVLHGTREFAVKMEKVGDGHTYKGSFEVKETGNYSIQAADNAGNLSEQAVFTPMSMKIKPITNISTSSATVGAFVRKGTFPIQSVSVAYRKYTDTSYRETQSIANEDANGNVTVSAVLSGLTQAATYVYKITAVSEGKEVLEYEGYFRTLSPDTAGISLSGTARYADNREGKITVGLFDGNMCIMASEINAGEQFVFDRVPDGMYNLVATDGFYSRTVGIMIEGGMVIYPTTYIEMVLSGMNTSVEITTSETPKVTADNMDSIFEYDNYNFTEKDKALIDDGGTVEFKLYATLMKVTSVSANEITAMYAVTDSNKIVGAYLDLSLYKIVTDANGVVERTRVTELGNGAAVSVTIPLGDMAGKPGLEVVRIHQDGDNFTGTSLVDMDNNPSTYTVTTSQFSTYAVLYNREAPVEEPTTERIDSGSPDPGTTGEIYVTTEKPSEAPTTERTGGSTATTESPGDNPNPTPAATSSTSVGSLRSTGSAKTGDEAPVAVMGMIMLMAMGGIVVLRRKAK